MDSVHYYGFVNIKMDLVVVNNKEFTLTSERKLVLDTLVIFRKDQQKKGNQRIISLWMHKLLQTGMWIRLKLMDVMQTLLTLTGCIQVWVMH